MTNLPPLLIARSMGPDLARALEHQKTDGGDLITCMLEVTALGEPDMLALVGEASGLPAVAPGPLPPATHDLRRIVPRAMAQKHALYPLAERDGALVVAVAAPLDPSIEDDLAFALGLGVEQRIALAVRIEQAIATAYGASLAPRTQKVLFRLEKPAAQGAPPAQADPPVPVVQPAPAVPSAEAETSPMPQVAVRRRTMPIQSNVSVHVAPVVDVFAAVEMPTKPFEVIAPRAAAASVVAPVHKAAAPQPEPACLDPNPTPIESLPAALPRRDTWRGIPPTTAPAMPNVPRDRPPKDLGGTVERATPVVPAPELGPTPVVPAPTAGQSVADVAPRPLAPPPAFVMEASQTTAAEIEQRRRRRAAHPGGTAALRQWARRALGMADAPSPSPAVRRGPLTPAAAELALQDARTPDDALRIFFEFARQYFEYAALFRVQGDLAEGYEAWGPGASRDKVRGIGFTLDLPSLLKRARDRAVPVIGRPGREGLDAVLGEDLGRSMQNEVVCIPIVVRARALAVLYGDHGDQPVTLDTIGEVIALVPLAAATLERILMRKKRDVLRQSRLPGASELPPAAAPEPPPQAVALPPLPLLPPLADADEQTRGPRTRRDVPVARPKRVIAKSEAPWSPEIDEGWETLEKARAAEESARAAALAAIPDTSSTPPPATVAAVRKIGGQPLSREEADASPVRAERVVVPDIHAAGAQPPRPRPRSAAPQLTPPDDTPDVTVGEVEADASVEALLAGEETPDEPRTGPPRPAAGARAGEGAVAMAPRAPPPSVRMRFGSLPPVLIHSDLVDRVIAGTPDSERALGEILEIGEHAVPAVFARFPGPLTADRHRAIGDLPRPAECGAVLRVISALRRMALPFLAVRSADASAEVRFWATYLLGDLHYPDAATALWPRLFDEDGSVRRVAAHSARALVTSSEVGAPIRAGLDRVVRNSGEPEARRLLAVSMIGDLRLFSLVPTLIALLENAPLPIVTAAAQTLEAMTRQELGTDARRWSQWWAAKGRARFAT